MYDSRQTYQLINSTKSQMIIDHLEIANRFWKRFKGLMGRPSLAPNHGIYISPCTSIHCFFMRFPIDVVFVDKFNTVVAIYPAVRPWSITLPGRGAHSVIEGSAGQLAHQVNLGDSLTIKETNHEEISPQ